MASSSVVVEFCCVCQEEYDSRPDLDLLRPDSCSSHWCHRDCLTDWLKHQKRCPTCLTDCSSAVDKYGEKISTEGTLETEKGPDIFDLDSEEEPDIFDLMYPDFNNFAQMLIHEFINLFGVVRPCLLCTGPMEMSMMIIGPCDHRYHPQCLMPRIAGGNRRCPYRNCRQIIVVIFRTLWNMSPSVVYYDPVRINNHPQYADLRDHLGLTTAPSTKPAPCALCGQIRPALARVLPSNCPGKHIVHEECMDQFAGTDSIRRCPVDGCGRQFLSLTRIPPPDSLATGGQASKGENVRVPEIRNTSVSPANVGECVVCSQDLTQEDAVRPNNCKHLYHRDCLFLVTNHNKKCPARKCGKKFRSVVKYSQ